jgi:hypothetical protein
MPKLGASRLLVCLLISFSAGCQIRNDAKVVGKYSTGRSCIEVTLLVKPDHTFLQKVTANDVEINRQSGTWRLNKKTDFVEFTPFLDFLDDDHGREVSVFSSPAEGIGAAVELGPVMVKCPDSLHKMNYVKVGF